MWSEPHSCCDKPGLAGLFSACRALGVACALALAAPAAADDIAARRVFEANCGACHNLDLPRSQRLTREVWDEVIRDMVEKFNATWITGPKAEIIAAYLAKYRGQAPLPEPELPPEAKRWQPEDPKIRALLTQRACVSCHTLERPLLGPPFAVVAERYRDDPAAPERLAKKIRAGGAGTWGSVPMPPNTGIPDAELKTIIDWVLSRR